MTSTNTGPKWDNWTLTLDKGLGGIGISWNRGDGDILFTITTRTYDTYTVKLDPIQADAIASTLFHASTPPDQAA